MLVRPLCGSLRDLHEQGEQEGGEQRNCRKEITNAATEINSGNHEPGKYHDREAV
jgi:hypothetical protein